MAFVAAPPAASRHFGLTGNRLNSAKCAQYGARMRRRSAVPVRMNMAAESSAKKALETQSHEVFMPALSSTMETGKIVQWLKQPGDLVKKGEPVMVVESDKADMDVESFEEGYLAVILVQEGESCGVGSTVGLIAKKKEDIEAVRECSIDCIVSGSGSRHDGTTAVTASNITPVADATPAVAPAAAVAAADAQPKPKMGEVFMPALSSTMTEGKIVDWLKGEGDAVTNGEIVMVVESDKADMDVESFDKGYIAHIIVQAGEQSPVGEPVAYIAYSEEDIPKVKAWALAQSSGPNTAASNGFAMKSTLAPLAPATTSASDNGVPSTRDATQAPQIVNTGRIVASPYAKKVAKQKGIDLRTIHGSGPNGRIIEADVSKAEAALKASGAASAEMPKSTKIVATPEAKKIAKKENIKLETITGTGNFGRITVDDVLRAAGKVPTPAVALTTTIASQKPDAPKSAPAAIEMPAGAVTMNAMQKAVVRNMNVSLSVPAFRVMYSIRTDAFDALYKKIKEKGVTVSAMLAKAVALTLAKHPIMNAAYAPDSIVYRPEINVGMAVALGDGGLITPVLKNADKTDLYAMSREWKGLLKRAFSKKLVPDEYNSGTFFISNMGMFGVDSFDAILPPGAPGILAVAASKPVVGIQENGLIGVSKVMKVNITCDHRHIYGAMAAEFLKSLADLIENDPMALLL